MDPFITKQSNEKVNVIGCKFIRSQMVNVVVYTEKKHKSAAPASPCQ